jgi:pyruvate formate lyase activating enzyme
MIKEARFFKEIENNRIQCTLCPVKCKLKEGQEGVCFGRKVIDGRLIATNYAKVVSVHVDPIEKKPLYHFNPGSLILSVGPNGCNLFCKHCQNWTISQKRERTQTILPEELIAVAKKEQSSGIAYTYAEPFIWFDYLLDVCKLAHENDLYNAFVTNGYINPEPLDELMPYIDALNIDVKSMRQDFYSKICKGKLEVVKNTVEATIKAGKHVEITYLVITDVNDSEDEFQDLVTWLSGIDVNIPLHFSRYFPNYKLDYPTTPINTLTKAYNIAKEKMKYVYVGNTFIEGTSDTLCPVCNNLLVNRSGYFTRVIGIEASRCTKCNSPVDFILQNV